ncbi:uncharacterized protein K460DRAFT_418149 [Cucurbitaria berberidis CBS 394.84]|uniref:Uncharacterized protein n=1 Tax=Cucurbitaria berberidis CBS 394.84 TaxID=1168544 RepID=A0A9P4GD45_9PLEO|nr:uncharacterized protein K460DRAFT_418149 [Cucurbitaria berberidis CBS 394.84]KAF1843010.1 hypothetical protein K460DRAFT_418149 [Cucurbitaria berberidis CBS 394.84]
MYGRGGAGNINAAKESSKKAGEDIEANHPPPSSASATAPSPPQQAPSNNAPPPQDYAHMGRGGAGNFYQPSTLVAQGQFTQPADSTALPTSAKPHISTPWHPEGQEMPVARSGRGGAGNFVWKSDGAGNKEKVEDEERRREEVREGVERDVEAGLARPAGVVLGRETERGW